MLVASPPSVKLLRRRARAIDGTGREVFGAMSKGSGCLEEGEITRPEGPWGMQAWGSSPQHSSQGAGL